LHVMYWEVLALLDDLLVMFPHNPVPVPYPPRAPCSTIAREKRHFESINRVTNYLQDKNMRTFILPLRLSFLISISSFHLVTL
jgi:hypothetical protein